MTLIINIGEDCFRFNTITMNRISLMHKSYIRHLCLNRPYFTGCRRNAGKLGIILCNSNGLIQIGCQYQKWPFLTSSSMRKKEITEVNHQTLLEIH